MDDYRIQWVGAPCGQHGPYIFYKGFKYFKDEKWKILSLGEFFFVRCSPEDPVCIGELQLLWEDKSNNGQLLSSLRLYFLPEDTPDGRSGSQGKDEVLAASDKVILKIEDLVDWTESGKDWNYGTVAIYEKDLKGDQPDHNAALLESFAINNGGLNVKDIKKEKKLIGDDPGNETKVIILSYPKYCRYITMMRRIQHVKDFWLRDALVTALGGFTVKNRNTRLVYCKEMFGHPTLSDNEKLCDHMAPNLKGRPRKKKTKIKHGKSPPEASSPASPDSSTNEAEITHTAPPVTPTHMKPGAKSKSERCYKDGVLVPNIKTRAQINGEDKEEVEFLSSLYQYMKERTTPIERIPHLGFKQIDLYYFYKLSQKWGGYERVCSRKLWKHIYDGLGGNPGSTSAATCTRRHYERLILPYERFLKGEDDRPLPSPVKHRKPHLIKKAEELTVKQQVKQERLLQLKQYEQTVEEKIMNAAQDYKVSPRVKSEVPKQNKENTTTPAVTQSVPVLLVQKVENVGVKPQVTFTKGVSSNEVKVKVEPTILVKKESHPVSTKSLSVNTQNVISVRVNKTLSIDAIPAVKMSSKCHSTVSTANIPPRAETLIRPALELRGIPSPIPSHLTPARVSPSILSPLVRKKTLSSPPVVTNIATPIKNTSLVATSRPSTPRSVTPKSRSGTPTQLRPVAPCKVQHTISQPVTAAGKEEAIRMRASVIQHTQHSQDSQIIKTESSAEDSVQDATNEIHAVQPSDLILRHISQDQMAINRAFYDSMIRPQPSTNSDSNGRKRSYENLVTPTHFPYYAYISPNSQGIPKLELSRIEDPYYDHTKRTKYPQDAKDSSKYYTKSFQNFSSDRKTESSPGVAHGGALQMTYVKVNDEEQPTDLSLPKKCRKSVDMNEKVESIKTCRDRLDDELSIEPKDFSMVKNESSSVVQTNSKKSTVVSYTDTKTTEARDAYTHKIPEVRQSTSQKHTDAKVISRNSAEARVSVTPTAVDVRGLSVTLKASENLASTTSKSAEARGSVSHRPAEARGSITQGVISPSSEIRENRVVASRSISASQAHHVSIPEYDPKLPTRIPNMMIPEYTPNIHSMNKAHIGLLDYPQLYSIGYPTHLLQSPSGMLPHSHIYGMTQHAQAYEEIMHQHLVASHQLTARHAQFASQHLAREGHPSYVYPN